MSDVGGLTGYILTPDQVTAWQQYDPTSYDEYVAAGLFDEGTNELYAFVDWMIDGDPKTGPFEIDPTNPGFDFGYNNSHEGIDW